MALMNELKIVQITEELVPTLLPKRNKSFHKGSCGHAVLFSGSDKYPGAALLSSEAAVYTGAGYVSLYAPKEVTKMALMRTPSILTVPYVDILETRKEIDQKADAILIGPGLGSAENLYKFLEKILQEKGCPVILDADAINELALKRIEGKRRLFKKAKTGRKLLKKAKREVLITPHLEEFSRISGVASAAIVANREKIVSKFAKEYKIHVLLKGDHSLIVDKTGTIYENTTGSVALAKAGSGDVLAGTIVSFAAALAKNGTKAEDVLVHAAILGAFFHGKAGDAIEKTNSIYGLAPQNLPVEISKAIADSIEKSGIQLEQEDFSSNVIEESGKKKKDKKNKPQKEKKQKKVVALDAPVETITPTENEQKVESPSSDVESQEELIMDTSTNEQSKESDMEPVSSDEIVEASTLESPKEEEPDVSSLEAVEENTPSNPVEQEPEKKADDTFEVSNPLEAVNVEDESQRSGSFF